MNQGSISRRRALGLMGALAGGTLAALAPHGALAQAGGHFPSRPLTLIMPFPAGGATDAQMRAVGLALGKELGQQVIVNQPGLAGTLAPATMARNAAADGYTVSIVPATLFRLPHLQKVTFDPTTDFSYVICLTGYTNGLVVRADAPWKTLQDLLADAKARPGRINYASTGIGSGGHIAMERLARAAGVQFNFAPYKGMAEETTALLGGHIDVISDPGWGALVDGGKARVLATLGSERLQRRPQVPTLKELGYDITVHSPVGVVAPKGLPPEVLKTLHDAFRRAMKDAEYQRILAQYDQFDMYMSSAEYGKYAVEQVAREKVFVEQLGIKLQ
jgi:tripartite-type tricarboxylate transporter receptor subunit TctC